MTPGREGMRRGGAGSVILRLLRKDIAVFRPRDRALVGFVFVLGALQTVPYDPAYFWFGIMLAGALVVAVLVVEWRQDTDRMLGSLPVSRNAVVSARYVSGVLACVVAWLTWAVTGHVLAPLLDSGRTSPALWATLEGTLTFAAVCVLLLALFLPLYFRLGLGRAVPAFMALGAAFYVAADLVAGTGAFSPGLPGPGPGGILARLFAPGAVLRLAIAGLLTRTGSAGGVAAVVAGLGLLLAASAGVSVLGFSRRDL